MELNNVDYTVIRLLGKGKGGYSYLVTDGANEYVLKQIHHEPCSYYTFADKLASELNDYERLISIGILVPRLLAVDKARERLLKEYIAGSTLFDMVLDNTIAPEHIQLVRQMGETARASGLNIDYFPTNFVLSGDKVYYIDYECNQYSSEWSFPAWGVKYYSHTPELEAYLKERASHA